jgi:hypothetical protein
MWTVAVSISIGRMHATFRLIRGLAITGFEPHRRAERDRFNCYGGDNPVAPGQRFSCHYWMTVMVAEFEVTPPEVAVTVAVPIV